MAIRFFNGISNISNLAFRPASFPVTISAWIRPEILSINSYQRAVTLMDDISNTIASIILNYPNSGNVSNQVYNGSVNALPYSTGLTANTWFNVIVISASTYSTIYLNGVKGTTENYSTPTYSRTLDRFHIGYIPSTQYYYGSVAQVGVWNTVLSVDDIKALSNAYSPDMICRGNLVAYYPLGGNYSDYKKERWKDKYDLTLTGTIQEIDHPRVRYSRTNKHSYITSSSTSQTYFGDISFNFDTIFNNNSNINIYSSSNIESSVNIGLSSNKIITPHITLNNENNLSTLATILIDGDVNLQIDTELKLQSQKIINSISSFLSSSELKQIPSTVISSILTFIQENNLTVIPSLIFNSQFTGSANSALGTTTQRLLNNSISISGNNAFSTLSSLVINGLFGPNADSILDSSLTRVDTGETLYGTAILHTLTRLGLSPSLLINGASQLANESLSNIDSSRIILPTFELKIDTESSLISTRIITGNLQAELSSIILNSTTRIQNGNLVLSNSTSIDSDGFTIINGVLIYEADSSLAAFTGNTFYNSISFDNKTEFIPSIIKLRMVPITLKIAKTYETSLKVNREKEIQLKIRKEYT